MTFYAPEVTPEVTPEVMRVLNALTGDMEADTFAFAYREKKISLTDVRAIGGMCTQDALSVLKRLVVQKLIEPIGNDRIF